jgi:ribosomal protein L11 methyltransferase
MDVAGVASAYRHQGVYLASHSLREGWATLVMKKAAQPRGRAALPDLRRPLGKREIVTRSAQKPI